MHSTSESAAVNISVLWIRCHVNLRYFHPPQPVRSPDTIAACLRGEVAQRTKLVVKCTRASPPDKGVGSLRRAQSVWCSRRFAGFCFQLFNAAAAVAQLKRMSDSR
jgi:hypothetical protein